MKDRILKKLCKKIVELRPNDYGHAWRDKYGIMCVGGDLDEWGEGQDWSDVLEDFSRTYAWAGMLGFYPEGHRFAGYPVHDKKRATGKRMIEMAKYKSKESNSY